MRSIAVISPLYIERQSQADRCRLSVQQNLSDGISTEHYFVSDGCSPVWLKSWKDTQEIILIGSRYNHADYGDYARRLATKFLCEQKDAILFLDSDNYWSPGHLSTVLKTHEQTGRNIIISDRVLVDENGKETEDFKKKFFDTNTITLFGDAKKIGLLWGRYPREMSLIGDRIISKYIQTHFADDIAYTNEATVNYSYSRISKERVNQFSHWFATNYESVADTFERRFGFSLKIAGN